MSIPVAPRPPSGRPKMAPPIDPHASVMLIGDSLSVGTAPYLAQAFPGRGTQTKAFGGIPLKTGMEWYRAAPKQPIMLIGLFTNNKPAEIGQLGAAIDETVRDARLRNGRVVWATIQHPGGDAGAQAYDGVNQLIKDKARANADVMRVVDWKQEVTNHPEYLVPDRVHATEAGYQRRAQMYAQAATSK